MCGRSGCSQAAPRRKQRPGIIVPGCDPGEETILLPTHSLPAADPRGLGDSAHSAPATILPPAALAPDRSRSTTRAWSSTRRRALAGEMDFSMVEAHRKEHSEAHAVLHGAR